MINEGAVMTEKLGWERPGYFLIDESVTIPPYDWLGYYGNEKHKNNRYEELVLGDCKYQFSDHHDLIGDEAINCRTNASIINQNYFCKLYLEGPEAQEAADWIFTADTKKDVNS